MAGRVAREISSEIRALLDKPGHEDVLREVSPRVTRRLWLGQKEAREPLREGIDLGHGDQTIINRALWWLDCGRDVVFLTDDTLAAANAQEFGLPYRLLPQAWLRPAETDETQKETARLKAAIARLQASEPQLEGWFEDAAGQKIGRIDATLKRYGALAPDLVETLVARVVAILRGLSAVEAPRVAAILNEAGISAAEVPLNRPGALDALRALAKAAPPTMMVGCGTAIRVDDVHAARAAGARFVVSPNADPMVIRATRDAGLLRCPGFRTMSEAYAAILAGADYLKLFPCNDIAPTTLKAMIAALPADPPPILCVGGIEAADMKDWLAADATGFGLGGSLFRPGMTPNDLRCAA